MLMGTEPTLGSHQWSHLSLMVVQPPEYHGKVGWKQTTRIESISPMKETRKCSLCGQLGHNKRSCKNNHTIHTKNTRVRRSSLAAASSRRGMLLVGPHNPEIIAVLTPILVLFVLNIGHTDCRAITLVLYIGLVG